jgi:aspartate/methionine/tyrosine aminotransferase
MKISNYRYILLVSIIILVFLILYKIFTKIKRNEEVKKETIISQIGEPYFITDTITPFNISLTGDNPGENGGLSYIKKYTNALNVELIHDMYKNDFNMELPKDTHIIFGAGTTMMISAVYYALQKKLNRVLLINTDLDVFYVLHRKLTYPAKKVEWVNPNDHADLAVLVSPSNPLGLITKPSDLKQKYQLYDVVYDKFIFTGKNNTVNEELYKEFEINKNIYIATSFSKLGLAGARFGFLLTRDNEIAKYAKEFVDICSVRYPTAGATISRIGYYRWFKNKNWKENIYNTIKERREFFYKQCEKHNITIYSKNDLVPYVYTNKSVEWWLKNFNVETRKGSDFNDIDDNSRFNLMISNIYWDEFVRRFS